jgi:hypothetical protein
MSNQSSLYRRISRRETHSPRSTLAIVVAVIAIVACVLVGTEIVLALASQPPLLASPRSAADFLVDVPGYPVATVIGVGAIVALLGLALVISALAPGRTARHELLTERSAAIVDNEVIASALARHAARAGNVDPDSVRVSVSHREAVVRVTPTSGLPVDGASVVAAVDEQLHGYSLRRSIRSKIIVAESGKVGA